MEVLEDVEEAIQKQGIVFDELVVLGDLPRNQEPQMGVNGGHLLQVGRIASHGLCPPTPQPPLL